MGILKIKAGKTIVFIDKANLHYALQEASWEIDYHRLWNWLITELPQGFIAYHYEGYFPDKAPGMIERAEEAETRKEAKFRFFKKIREIGYIVETKPINSVYDSTSGSYNRKCNFDVEIAITALDKIAQYNNAVLFSGDGDFTKLVKYLKGKFKQTIVISAKKRTSRSILDAANQFINLNNLKDQIERK